MKKLIGPYLNDGVDFNQLVKVVGEVEKMAPFKGYFANVFDTVHSLGGAIANSAKQRDVDPKTAMAVFSALCWMAHFYDNHDRFFKIECYPEMAVPLAKLNEVVDVTRVAQYFAANKLHDEVEELGDLGNIFSELDLRSSGFTDLQLQGALFSVPNINTADPASVLRRFHTDAENVVEDAAKRPESLLKLWLLLRLNETSETAFGYFPRPEYAADVQSLLHDVATSAKNTVCAMQALGANPGLLIPCQAFSSDDNRHLSSCNFIFPVANDTYVRKIAPFLSAPKDGLNDAIRKALATEPPKSKIWKP